MISRFLHLSVTILASPRSRRDLHSQVAQPSHGTVVSSSWPTRPHHASAPALVPQGNIRKPDAIATRLAAIFFDLTWTSPFLFRWYRTPRQTQLAAMLEIGQVYVLLGTFAVIFILQRLSAFRQEERAIGCGSDVKQ